MFICLDRTDVVKNVLELREYFMDLIPCRYGVVHMSEVTVTGSCSEVISWRFHTLKIVLPSRPNLNNELRDASLDLWNHKTIGNRVCLSVSKSGASFMWCGSEYATGFIVYTGNSVQCLLNTTAYQHPARAANLTRQETKSSVAM